tara:strand:- start:2774 stop:3838 length:1065 start_codon:yes stop_codon:yes gene_type:complete
MISEQDNAPEEVKIRVRQMTKAIRYKARKEGGNLFKAFNDYMGSQSGISATERASVKQSLGLSETYSSWRDDLREVVDVPEKDTDADKVIKEKKVKNKIVINPPMKEAFDEIGATVIEAVELEETSSTSKEEEAQKKKQLQVKTQMLKKRQMLDRMRLQMQKQGKLPIGHAEGYAPGDVDQKVGAVTGIPKSEQDAARARILAKAKAKAKMKKEELEVEGFIPMDSAKKAKIDRQIGRAADKEAIESGKSKKYGRDDKKIDKLYKRQIAMKFQHKMKKEEVEVSEARKPTEDSLRDRRMERGGVDGNNRYDRAPGKPNTFGKKKPASGMSAIDKVRADITAKYGKGAIYEPKKK